MAYMHGFDRNGYDWEGFDLKGYNREGYNRNGYFRDGYNKDGYNRKGYSREGYDRDGYTPEGYDMDGYSRDGFDRDGYNRDGIDRDGYNRDGFDRDGFNKGGIDRKGRFSPSMWAGIISSIVQPITMENNFRTQWAALKQCESICDADRELAFRWVGDEKENDFIKAKMLSARMAEKVAIEFYNNLGFKVKDMSIVQVALQPKTSICNASEDWKLYDILLNDKICVDVKNSRTPLNSDITYFEHCVSKFKKNRNGQDVIIAGVLSNYVKYKYMQNPIEINYDPNIIFLGETTLPIIHQLKKWFNSRDFLELTVSSNNFIPRWVFEYPHEFYKNREQAQKEIQNFSLAHTPSLVEFHRKNTNPIPAYLSSGVSLPDAWMADLKQWQILFYNRLRPSKNRIITMPILFLALLTHFLEALIQEELWDEYDPSCYRQLIYDDISNDRDCQMPLGIFDPTYTIDILIKTFSILWDHKDSTGLGEYKIFKFNGVGLLEGKKVGKTGYETILAYCGGYVEGLGKCGNNPLIIGMHESCPECGKLICEKCGHCKESCSFCHDRMERNRAG